MRRRLFASGSLRILNLLVLGVVVAATAFEMGRARASRAGPDRRRTHVVDAVQHAAPAVVSVYAQQRRRRNVLLQSAGSGVIVHPAGYVITNSHVIRGGSAVYVELFGEGGRHRAQVVADLPHNDLALLRIRRPRPFPYVSIASTRSVMLGEAAIAVGNPRGLGDTITVGVVSALGRKATLKGGTKLDDLIQTDASINNGNSGGALLNLDGELMGVIVSLMPSSDGIAFAIPGDQVRGLLHRALGGAPAAKRVAPPASPAAAAVPRIASSTRSEAHAPADGLPPPRVREPDDGRSSGPTALALRPEDLGFSMRASPSGLQVVRVVGGTAADRAGVLPGDVLRSVDARGVSGPEDLSAAFAGATPGTVLTLVLRRGGSERTVLLVAPR